MRIIIGLLSCGTMLSAVPASAEVCSRIATDIFSVPRNDPRDGLRQDRDAPDAAERRQAEEVVRQMMRRGDPFVFRPDGSSAGWPCLRSHAVHIKDEVVRQKAMSDEFQEATVMKGAVDAGRGVSTVTKAASDLAGDAVLKARSHEWSKMLNDAKAYGPHGAGEAAILSKADALNAAVGSSIKGTGSDEASAIKGTGI